MALLLFLPFAARYLFPAARREDIHSGVRFPYIQRVMSAFSVVSYSSALPQKFFLTLLILLWVSFVMALMRPEIVNKIDDIQAEGYDIMLAVDLSGSMRVQDFTKGWLPVSRLDIAKEVVGDFVKEREADRIGLVVFGSFAYQYTPLTLDHETVVKMLNSTVETMAGEDTAIGDAIGLSVKALRDREEKSRIIILLTDGEDTSSSIPPMQATRLAKQYGIKIYTIAIGQREVARLGFGGGRTIMNTNLLKDIARETGGGFFMAKDADALKQVYKQIDRLEKTKAESRTYVTRKPLYRYPLAAGLFLLFIISLFPLFTDGIVKEKVPQNA